MTLLKPTVVIRRVLVIADGKSVYDEPFHDGVNIIRGTNGSGKSTIADLLFFGLGGDLREWKPEAAACDEVIVELESNGVPLSVGRSISQQARQPMRVFLDRIEVARSSAVEGWRVYQFQRSSSKESFSQVLFRVFGLPEVRSDLGSTITMHQVLRLIYVDQLSSVQDILRSEQFDTSLTREAVRDLLLGVYDDELYRAQLKLRETERELEVKRRELESAIRLLKRTGQPADVDEIESSIDSTRSEIEDAQRSIEMLQSEVADSATDEAAASFATLESSLVAARKRRTEASATLRSVQLDVEDSRDFIAVLRNRIESIEHSQLTREEFGALPLTHCPHCLTPLRNDEPDGTCILCGQASSTEGQSAQALRIQQEMAFQLKESEILLEGKEDRVRELNRSLPALIEKERILQSQFDSAVRKARSSRDQQLDSQILRKGRLENALEMLHRQAKAASIVHELRDDVRTFGARQIELKALVQSHLTTQSRRKVAALRAIQDVALHLLASDLPREDTFSEATSVTLDFRRNAFSVDGRNVFSASSLCYLKNCIHYAILFASLKNEFFRYPRLLVCDNMEDKGMEEARSQNFQREVVRLSQAQETAHQIIFTTSMIAPELDNTDLCVGEHYTKDNKTLRF